MGMCVRCRSRTTLLGPVCAGQVQEEQMRYVFLILGFFIVAVLGDLVGGSNQKTVTAVGGGLVYVIFMSMKKE